jgi:hypothetical protein
VALGEKAVSMNRDKDGLCAFPLPAVRVLGRRMWVALGISLASSKTMVDCCMTVEWCASVECSSAGCWVTADSGASALFEARTFVSIVVGILPGAVTFGCEGNPIGGICTERSLLPGAVIIC